MYTIGQVAEMFGLPVSTLRYYDKQGLFPELERTSGIRRFGDTELEALRVIECLKKAGMEIKDIRLFIVDCTPWAEEDPSCADYKRAFVNPEIYAFSEEKKTYNEGCLSFPGIHADVPRSLSIRMRYMDTDFVEHDEEFTGLKAWVIQHEYDHIEGVVFTDRIAPLRRQLLKSKLLNLAKGKYRCAYKTR